MWGGRHTQTNKDLIEAVVPQHCYDRGRHGQAANKVAPDTVKENKSGGRTIPPRSRSCHHQRLIWAENDIRLCMQGW